MYFHEGFGVMNASFSIPPVGETISSSKQGFPMNNPFFFTFFYLFTLTGVEFSQLGLFY